MFLEIIFPPSLRPAKTWQPQGVKPDFNRSGSGGKVIFPVCFITGWPGLRTENTALTTHTDETSGVAEGITALLGCCDKNGAPWWFLYLAYWSSALSSAIKHIYFWVWLSFQTVAKNDFLFLIVYQRRRRFWGFPSQQGLFHPLFFLKDKWWAVFFHFIQFLIESF